MVVAGQATISPVLSLACFEPIRKVEAPATAGLIG